MMEYKKGASFSIVCTYFWLAKQQKLTKLHKAVRPYFPTIFHIAKSGLSLNNKEILCGDYVKL